MKCRLKPFRLIAMAMVFTLVTFAFPCQLFAGEEQLLFLPPEPVFEALIADPREPHDSLQINDGPNAYEGSIGSIIEILQWRPEDQTRWGFGILAGAYIGLGNADFTSYPKRVEMVNGLFVYNAFPERVSDWQLGLSISESSGPLSHRIEFVHFSSHLGDELFGYVPRFIYTRESFRFTSSFKPSVNLRFYAGVGYWGHVDPVEKPFFIHAGTEIFSDGVDFLFKTTGCGYLGYDLKIKDEAGGILNQTVQFGFRWKWKKESTQAIRLAVLYHQGNSEYGQFYQQRDDHWGFGIYFDP